MAEQAKEKPKGRTLRSVQITGVSFVKKPPDPNCRIKAIIGPKTPTTIEHDPGIECPSCGGSIVERISFKPGTTIQQAQLWIDTGKEKAKAIGSRWVCTSCDHSEARY